MLSASGHSVHSFDEEGALEGNDAHGELCVTFSKNRCLEVGRWGLQSGEICIPGS